MTQQSSPYLTASFLILFIFLGLTITSTAAADQQGDKIRLEKAIGMYHQLRNRFPNVGDISPHSAISLLENKDVVFVDIRREYEQRVSMIPGALTKGQFLDTLEDNSGKKVIAYCTIGYRSGKFAKKMKRKGIQVLNLQAGILGWVHAGGKVTDGEQEVRRIHVYGKTWDLAPADVKTIY